MKKRNLKVLKLNKKAISSFQVKEVKGGCPTDNCKTTNWQCQQSGPNWGQCW